MTKFYLVDDAHVEAVLENNIKDLYFLDMGKYIVTEWTWQYKEPTDSDDWKTAEEEDKEWICIANHSDLPDGKENRIVVLQYQNGDHFFKEFRRHRIVNNPSEKELAELFGELIDEWLNRYDDRHVYRDDEFVDGEWMGTESDWNAQGWREMIRGDELIYEEYPTE